MWKCNNKNEVIEKHGNGHENHENFPHLINSFFNIAIDSC